MITFDKVSFSYEDKKVLDNLSFTIKKGDFTVIMGDNGCGKSTLLKIINGLAFNNAGKYVFNGNIITKDYLKSDHNMSLFHQRIGFVFQNYDVQLFNATVYDEVAFGLRTMGLSVEEIEQRVSDSLELLNIEELNDRVPYNLSGGEKKKVVIAAVVAMNPQVIVLDEPFNGLSMHYQDEILELLKQLNKLGKTIILTTHRYDQIKEAANHFLIFENHTIKYELSDKELYRHKDLEDYCRLL